MSASNLTSSSSAIPTSSSDNSSAMSPESEMAYLGALRTVTKGIKQLKKFKTPPEKVSARDMLYAADVLREIGHQILDREIERLDPDAIQIKLERQSETLLDEDFQTSNNLLRHDITKKLIEIIIGKTNTLRIFTGLTATQRQILSSILKNSSHLRELEFKVGNSWELRKIIPLLAHATSVESLILSNSDFMVTEVLNSFPSENILRKISLFGSELGEEGVPFLTQYFPLKTTLTDLTLSCIRFKPGQLSAIIKSLNYHHTLESLHLVHLELELDTSTDIVRLLDTCSTLSTLSLSQRLPYKLTHPIISMLPLWTSLTTLNLCDNPINYPVLGDAISQSTSIRSLSFCYDSKNLGIGGITEISRGLSRNSSLQTLLIFDRTVTTATMESLAAGLSKHPSITDLTFSHQDIDRIKHLYDPAWKDLEAIFKRNKKTLPLTSLT